ncbi:MAG: ribosome small subunit-dependent GTPase A [Mogibacterium sp.]|nr:ribosome small subunit-dependent GTPase A [Mogibacterium sp.]
MIGTVVKGIGGFYFVYDGNDVVMGKARGNLKRDKEIIYVGDIVDFEIDENDSDGEAVINSVVERRNHLSRPPVSNLDMLVVVFSLVQPEVNFPVVDKLIAACEQAGIAPAVCISKIDLAEEKSLEEVKAIYSALYPTAIVNALSGEGIEDLERIISGKNVALAGPSGVGKSTISNHLLADLGIEVETGDVSDKTRRGRHTTRHVEIFALSDGTQLYDTPGFTSLELQETEPSEIRKLFKEMRGCEGECRYRDCMHINEPDCAVKTALEKGDISRSRYDSYLHMTEEAKKWLK